MAISITDEMRCYAKEEAKKRHPFIRHHFDVSHLTNDNRDVIGFLGEFACCEYFEIDWKKNIRENYLTIDKGDIINKNIIFDVKTETLPDESPNRYFTKVCSGLIDDDKAYGRRLIVAGQIGLLHKYDIVIFGAFKRNNYDYWHPIGYLESKFILDNYQVTKITPFGGIYPEAALAIRTSDLKNINDLKKMFLG